MRIYKQTIASDSIFRVFTRNVNYVALKYFHNFECYFYLQVVISGPYNYSSPKVQEGLERLLSELENTTYIDPLYTESWLRDFLDYVRRNQDYSPIDISNEKAFIEALNVVSLQKRKD